MQALTPQSTPIGVLPVFAVDQPTTLVVKEKMFTFSGDDFSIKDTNGVVVCRVDGKALSLRDAKDFVDAYGNPLFTLTKKLFSLHGSHEAHRPDGQLLFEVKGKFKMFGSEMVAEFTNAADKRRISIKVRGDWIDKRAEMLLAETGAVLATVSRQIFNMRDVFGGKQTYYVQVAPGVDLVMIAALAVTFDERQNEK